MTDYILTHETFETYAWSVASLLLIFFAAIAFFYQKKFGIRTYYYLYSIPFITQIVTAANLFYFNRIISESIEIVGPIISFVLSFYLYKIMVGVKK